MLLAALALAGCAPGEAGDMSADCVAGGLLRADLYGDVEAALDWHGAGLACEGMRRPREAGARLRFAGRAGERRLAFIVALPGLERGRAARELPATVTLIEEDNGRFYSTADNEHCWSDVDAQEALPGSAGEYRVSGILYCVSPLAEQAGNGRVTLGELRYTGRVDWRSPD